MESAGETAADSNGAFMSPEMSKTNEQTPHNKNFVLFVEI